MKPSPPVGNLHIKKLLGGLLYLFFLSSALSLSAQVTSITTGSVTGNGGSGSRTNLQANGITLEAVNFYDPNNSTSSGVSSPVINGVTYVGVVGSVSSIMYSPTSGPSFTLTNVSAVEDSRSNLASTTPVGALCFSGLLPNPGANATFTLTLQGLTTGTSYGLQLIFSDYGDSYTRSATVTDGGVSTTVNDISNGSANYVLDSFKASGTTETITITGNTNNYGSAHFAGLNLAIVPAIPPTPTVTVGPQSPYHIYGPDYNNMNDVTPPLITLSDGTGIMCIGSAGSSQRFVGPDLDHLNETNSSVTFTDAAGDNGAWHNAPGSIPGGGNGYGSLIWLSTLGYATDGKLVGFLIGNEFPAGITKAQTWNGVGVSTDQGHTFQLLGEIPVGGCSVVRAPSGVTSPTGAPFYWYTIGGTASDNGAGSGQMLYASNDVHGAPGSWYVWNGPSSWISISMSTNLAITGTPLPTLPGGLNYDATLIDEQYLASQNGQAHEYLITYNNSSNTLLGSVSYDCVNWSSPFTIGPNTVGFYNRIWDAGGTGGDLTGGQDLVEIFQGYYSDGAALSSRNMSEYAIHFGALTKPAAPTIRDASPVTNILPGVDLSWTDTQAQTYTVYRSTNGGAYNAIASSVNAGGNYTDYLDTGVTLGQNYSYYVTATNSKGTSAASNVASATAGTIASAYSLQSGFESAYLDGGVAPSAGNFPLLEAGSGAVGQRWMLASTDQAHFTLTNAQTGLNLEYNSNSTTPTNISYTYNGAGQVDVEIPTGGTKQLWTIPAHDLHFLGSFQVTMNEAAGQVLEDVQDSSNNGEVYLDTLTSYWPSDYFSSYPQGQTTGAFLVNASFETPVVPSGLQYSPNENGWLFLPAGSSSGNSASGLVGPGSSPTVPDGRQVAFVEKQGSISQNPIVFDGDYTLAFSAVQHSGSSQTLTVYIDGAAVGSVTPSGSKYATYSVGPFRVAGTTDIFNVGNTFPNSHNITIGGASTSDGVVYIDKVSLMGAKLSGAIIGTPGSFNNSGTTIKNVFDGNINTYFDAPSGDGDWAGLNFGTTANLMALSYAPRIGYESRMVGGIFQGSTTPDFSSGVTNLAPAIATAPADGLNTIFVSGSYQYVRYLGPNGSYGDIAEMQVWGAFAKTRLSGTIIGTPGSFQNDGNIIDNVFDGNLNTFLDAPSSDGAWAGLDLGTAANLTSISYAPRIGYESRMVGGIFQGSTTSDFSSGVINLAPAIVTAPPDGLTTISISGSYRYVRYLAPNGSNGNIAEMQVFGN